MSKVVAYRLKRAGCHGWIHAGTDLNEVCGVLCTELDTHEGLPADERDTITIEAYETTQAEIDALPEFEGW